MTQNLKQGNENMNTTRDVAQPTAQSIFQRKKKRQLHGPQFRAQAMHPFFLLELRQTARDEIKGSHAEWPVLLFLEDFRLVAINRRDDDVASLSELGEGAGRIVASSRQPFDNGGRSTRGSFATLGVGHAECTRRHGDSRGSGGQIFLSRLRGRGSLLGGSLFVLVGSNRFAHWSVCVDF